MATPHVAGVAALYLQEKNNGLTPLQLAGLLNSRASRIRFRHKRNHQ
ncbi:S8 family serine peptidase [Vibrio chagasii]|nr:S8 family serine peptidase [Vibrio chagasii]